MAVNEWQLTEAVDAVIFDCDGTLSHLEGIDELAEKRGVGEVVRELTQAAMNETGINSELYQQRMDLVRPDEQLCCELADDYFQQLSPHLQIVLDALVSQGKVIYVVSAGITPAVLPFARRLGVASENVYAVGVRFDENGCYVDFDRHSSLVHRNGKREIVAKIKQKHARVVHVGDGMNDVEAMDLVARFIGYGGKFYRESIARLCQFYLTEASMLPVLPLCFTAGEAEQLDEKARRFYEGGLEILLEGGVELR